MQNKYKIEKNRTISRVLRVDEVALAKLTYVNFGKKAFAIRCLDSHLKSFLVDFRTLRISI